MKIQSDKKPTEMFGYVMFCVGAKYDRDSGVMQVAGWAVDEECFDQAGRPSGREFYLTSGEFRVIEMHKSDFKMKAPKESEEELDRYIPASDEELSITAEMFKNKPFNFYITNDPARRILGKEEEGQAIDDFRQQINDMFSEVSKGMTDADRIISRRVEEVLQRERERHENS